LIFLDFYYFSSLSDIISITIIVHEKSSAKATRNRHYVSASRLP